MRSVENFYALEGLDATGKSTVRDLLKEMGYKSLRTPPDNFPVAREKYDNLDVRLRFIMYLMGVIQVSKEVGADEMKKLTICDRYLLSTLTYHKAMGLSDKFISNISPIFKCINVPEETFLLVVNEQERMKRLLKRGANDNDIANLKINDKALAGYRSWAKKLNYPLREIDTSEISPDDVSKYISSIMENHKYK